MITINGKETAKVIKEQIKQEVDALTHLGYDAPLLVAVKVGTNAASDVYVRNKVKACEACGFRSEVIELPEETTEAELLDEIDMLNTRNDVNGFIVQLPLPEHINEQHIIEAIAPEKDVDGFTPINLGKMVIGEECFVPATPQGILNLLDAYKIETKGKNVVVIGRSNIVGKPIANLLMQKGRDANVTVCHSRTPKEELNRYIANADIIIAAVGVPKFVQGCKIGATIIDVGINRVDGKLIGDVDFDKLSPYVYAMTPVPGGVGPMTVCALMENTLKAFKIQHGIY